MHSKFTNQELYDWMIGQVASIFFQSYQLAYDVAKHAEQAYRYELGLDQASSNFIQFGYWDSLKKGLLSGEKLYHDIKRMEISYLDKNKREYELTKHISLATLNPLALVELKQTGQCFVDLWEWLFDMDYPGHYTRRIKSVSITIPCVTGPYTSISCILKLVTNKIRKTNTIIQGNEGPQYNEIGNNNTDSRFMYNLGAIQSIATSNAQNDSGLFELNLRDERYLPFEGAGVISNWQIILDKGSNHFDFSTISDVILHLRYTARDGGDSLKSGAKGALPRSGARLFSLKHEFSSEWYRLLNMADTATGDHIQEFKLTQDHFPFYARSSTINVTKVHVFAIPKSSPPILNEIEIYLTPANETPNETNDQIILNVQGNENDDPFGGIPHEEKTYSDGQERRLGDWRLKFKSADVSRIVGSIDDIWLLFSYSVSL